MNAKVAIIWMVCVILEHPHKMRLKEKGRFLELPIIGLTIKEVVYDGLIRVVFNDDEESYLEFHSEFRVHQYNQEKTIKPNSEASLVFFYHQFGQTIIEAKADKFGVLWIKFENSMEIIVEDGPYENWHYTKINKANKIDNLCMHGGVGRTTYWQNES